MKIDKLFEKYKGKKPVLIGYFIAGYPTPDKFIEYIKQSVEVGLDCIEIGIPAKGANLDGKIISTAMKRAIKNGISPEKAVILSGKAIARANTHSFIMLYHSTLNELGMKYLFSLLKDNGIDGILVPDLPLENWNNYTEIALSYQLSPIGFISAKMNDNDILQIVSRARGFLYMQSYSGITGEKVNISNQIESRIKRIKEICGYRKLPVAVGFGIKSRYDVMMLYKFGADGIIIGTALLEALEKGMSSMINFVSGISNAISQVL